MSYKLTLSREAARTLDRLDRPTERRIRERLYEVAATPHHQRLSKALRGAMEGLRSSRLGDWRVLFVVRDQERVVHVLAIRPRGQAYR